MSSDTEHPQRLYVRGHVKTARRSESVALARLQWEMPATCPGTATGERLRIQTGTENSGPRNGADVVLMLLMFDARSEKPFLSNKVYIHTEYEIIAALAKTKRCF